MGPECRGTVGIKTELGCMMETCGWKKGPKGGNERRSEDRAWRDKVEEAEGTAGSARRHRK